MSLYKFNCHQEAQEESSNPAALELEYAYLLTQIQHEKGLSLEEITALLDELEWDMEQNASAPSQSTKKCKLSDYQPSTSQSVADFSCVPGMSRERSLDDTFEDMDLLETLDGEELTKFLEELEQETEGFASEPIESNLCPSPKRTKVLDYQPCSDWLTAITWTATWKRTMDHREEEFPLPPLSLEEILEFLEEQDTEQVASNHSKNDLSLSPKRTKLSDDQLCSNWLMASYVPSTPTRFSNRDMVSSNKIHCHQEAQEELLNPAAQIELEFAKLFMQVQKQTVQQKTEHVFSTNNALSRKGNLENMEEEVLLPPPSFGEFLDFLKEFARDLELVASEPSTSDFAPSPKRSNLSDCQLSTSQSVADFSCVPPTTINNTVPRERTLDDREEEFPLQPLSLEEIIYFFQEFERETEQDASEPSPSDFALSPKESKLTDYQPSKSQSVADFVPPTTTNNTMSRERSLDDTFEDMDLLETLDGKELTKFLEVLKQETEGVASKPIESNLCLSSTRTKVLDYQPCYDWLTVGPYVPSTPTRETCLPWDKPYIKKPLNSFMIFRAEHRQRVSQEIGTRDSARINAELGRRWKMMSKEKKAPYSEKALRLKRAHEARYPDWSAKDNFCKRRKTRAASNDHHFGFPADQQPWPYATGPTSFPLQAPYHQGPYYATWGPSQHSSYQPGGPSWCPHYQPGGPSQGPYYQPGGPNQGPYYQPRGPTRGPYYQPKGPSQSPYNEPGGPSQGPHYQFGGPSEDPYYQPGGPSQGPHYQPGGLSPYCRPGVPSQGPYYQPGGPSQGPYYQPGGSGT